MEDWMTFTPSAIGRSSSLLVEWQRAWTAPCLLPFD
jgi:hypothetical protein